MEKEIDYNFYYEYLFKVLRHLFLNEELDSLNKEEDYVILYHIAKSHDIVSLIYYGVKDILPPSIEIKWGNKVNQNLFKSISQLEEKKIIDQLFNENQIEHTFLKGCYLKEIYPSPDFREMSDIDILVHDYDLKKIHSLLESKLNYEHESSEGSHHQTYLKKPVHNIEVHYELVDDDLPQYQYFHDYFNRLISVDNSYEKIMNLNDYFVYFLFHAYHHFYLCGIGIRYIIDLFVLLSKHKQDLDFDYINKDNLNVFVDYAHTPDALINVLNALRGVGFEKIVTVFGCPGFKSYDRRTTYIMGP